MRNLAIAALVLLALAGCARHEARERETPPAASSGTSTPAMTEDQARRLLRDQGYSDIRDMHRVGDAWEARATRNESLVTVDIDNYGIVHLH
ncbi:MAG TPA: hypothetical protein VKT70_03800 [Stellaceae bacterium]|nr:hypothetical protein [Stellaceae bacterium]